MTMRLLQMIEPAQTHSVRSCYTCVRDESVCGFREQLERLTAFRYEDKHTQARSYAQHAGICQMWEINE